MKTTSLILFILCQTISLSGQISIPEHLILDYRDFDTLQVEPDRTLISYKSYSDTILVQENQAYFYPSTDTYDRVSILGYSFWEKEVLADSIVRHGLTRTYYISGDIEEATYSLDSLVEVRYYNAKGEKISTDEFESHENEPFPILVKLWEKYFQETEKRKNKNMP